MERSIQLVPKENFNSPLFPTFSQKTHKFWRLGSSLWCDISKYVQLKLDFVQLCETQMFNFVLFGNVILISSFQKYTTFWHFVIWCICVL